MSIASPAEPNALAGEAERLLRRGGSRRRAVLSKAILGWPCPRVGAEGWERKASEVDSQPPAPPHTLGLQASLIS